MVIRNLQTHKYLVYFTSFCFVLLIVNMTINGSSCKDPLIFILLYPALTLLAFVISRMLRDNNSDVADIYKNVFIGLLILFAPLVALVFWLVDF